MDFFLAHAGVISDAPSITDILGNIVRFLLSVAGIIAILAIVVAAIRYLVSGNEKQATVIKKSLAMIVIGLVVLFGAMVFISAIGSFFAQ